MDHQNGGQISDLAQNLANSMTDVRTTAFGVTFQYPRSVRCTSACDEAIGHEAGRWVQTLTGEVPTHTKVQRGLPSLNQMCLRGHRPPGQIAGCPPPPPQMDVVAWQDWGLHVQPRLCVV